MILTVSYRTDIPAFYSEWWFNRLKEGFLYQRNPSYIHNISIIDLSPKVIDVIVFCSKNYKPFITTYRKEFEDMIKKYRCYFMYTITGYGKKVEVNVPGYKESLNTFKELSNIVGKDKVVWRYDPILFTKDFDLNWHKSAFGHICEDLYGYTNKCTFSFIHTYGKTKKNMQDLLSDQNVYKEELLDFMNIVSEENEIVLQTCGMGNQYSKWNNIKLHACIDKDSLEEVFNIKFKNVKENNNRVGCKCIENKSIGDYNTCMNGCRYCYATSSLNESQKEYNNHNPKSPLLIGEVKEDDNIIESHSKSILSYKDKNIQLNLDFNMEKESEDKLPKSFIPINYDFSKLKEFQELENSIQNRINEEKQKRDELFEKMKAKEAEINQWNEEHKNEIEHEWQQSINENLQWLNENPENKSFLLKLFECNNSWGLSLSEEDGYVHDAYVPMSRGRLIRPWIIFNRYKDNG